MPPLEMELCEWTEIVSRKLPRLSRSEARVLALYSFGMVLVQKCGISHIAEFLGMLLGRKPNSVRQQLREFTYAGEDKRGAQRQTVIVDSSFGDLLGWVLSWWADGEQRLALAMDATSYRDVFTILVISVVYRGCAIPVAWRVVAATQVGAWRPHWEQMFDLVQPHVPPTWTVLVLADRGLYAKWLYQYLVKRHWHPFLRINAQGLFALPNSPTFRPLQGWVNPAQPNWSGTVRCFKGPQGQLHCTLLAHFDPTYADPWLILTDLAPRCADIAWYGMRSWIEAGFKDLKRGGWSWHHTKMTDPDRAARLWFVMAVATIWVLSVGGYAEADVSASSLPYLPPYFPYRTRPQTPLSPRRLSIFSRGLLIILVSLLRHDGLFFGDFVPEPWPSSSLPFANTYP